MSGTPINWCPRFLRKRPAAVPKGVKGFPMGLEASEVEALRALLGHPGWARYQLVLERQFESDADTIIRGGLDYDRYLFQSGVCMALRLAAELPQRILDACPPPVEDDLTDGHSAGRRIFANSPLWERFTRLTTESPARPVPGT